MKINNVFNRTALFVGLFVSFSALSEMVAITNTTVYTGTNNGVLTDVNVVIENGKIVSFNPSSLEVDRTVDGQGRILTAGFISSLSQLGLVEVSAVKTSRDERPRKSGASFDVSMAFNPETTLIPFARKGGITHAVVAPKASDDMFAGQTFNVELTSGFDSVIDTGTAVVAKFGATSKDSRAVSLNNLKEKLEARVKKREDSDKKDDGKEPSADEKVFDSLLDNKIPLIAFASRPSDILHLVNIKNTFNFKLAIAGGQGAVKVKAQLADANVPVIIGGVDNLPGNFDSLDSSLKNAGVLDAAGVKVIFAIQDAHMVKNLRFDAGNAISHGMSVTGALAALTSNVAELYGVSGGVVEVGSPANLVLWSGDPFEISSKVEMLWIDGVETSTESRQDKLRDRYISNSTKRTSYNK